MSQYFLIIVFCLSSSFTFGQSNRDKLRSLMEDDDQQIQENVRSNHSGRYQYTASQQVPSWFINPPVSDNHYVYAIGISDPGLDSVSAINMALYRAEIIANVLKRSTTQLLCDFFMDDQQNASNVVYENYCRIYTNIPYGTDPYEIVHTYYNDFNEAIVLIKYNALEGNSTVGRDKVECEVYKNETEHSIYGDYESVYELMIKQDSLSSDVPMFYQLTELGVRNNIVTQYDGMEIEMPIYSLRYANLPGNDTIITEHFSHGLWKEYYKSIITEISIVARTKPENLSALSERYQADSYQKLTSGISQNRMRFVLTGINTNNNQLKVELTEMPLLSE